MESGKWVFRFRLLVKHLHMLPALILADIAGSTENTMSAITAHSTILPQEAMRASAALVAVLLEFAVPAVAAYFASCFNFAVPAIMTDRAILLPLVRHLHTRQFFVPVLHALTQLQEYGAADTRSCYIECGRGYQQQNK